jgi:hypothetical protein
VEEEEVNMVTEMVRETTGSQVASRELGELIGEESGSVSSFRVTREGLGVKIETQFQATGKILGLDVVDYATYWAIMRPDGNFDGGSDGMIVASNGEAAAYSGKGVGHMLGRGGAATWHGAQFCVSTGKTLGRLNSVATLFEFDIDETARKMTIKLYEWK